MQGLRGQFCKLLCSFTSCSSCEEGKKLFLGASSSSQCTEGPVLCTLKSMVKPWVQKMGFGPFFRYESVKRSSDRRGLAKPSQIQVVRVFKSLVSLPGAIANLPRFAVFCRAWNCCCEAWTRMMTGWAVFKGSLLTSLFYFWKKTSSFPHFREKLKRKCLYSSLRIGSKIKTSPDEETETKYISIAAPLISIPFQYYWPQILSLTSLDFGPNSSYTEYGVYSISNFYEIWWISNVRMTLGGILEVAKFHSRKQNALAH